MDYHSLIPDLKDLSVYAKPQAGFVCQEAAKAIERLSAENERLSMELKHMEEAAASAKSEKFSLQDFVRTNLIPPGQRVCLCEHIDGQFAKSVWRGPFRTIPKFYTQRIVEQVFVPVSNAELERYRFTLCILLAPEP